MTSLRVVKVFSETSSEVLRDSFLHPSTHQSICLLVSEIFHRLKGFREWRLEHVGQDRNRVASLIAITRDHRYQSYVATGGPSWLQGLLDQEAFNSNH